MQWSVFSEKKKKTINQTPSLSLSLSLSLSSSRSDNAVCGWDERPHISQWDGPVALHPGRIQGKEYEH